MTRVNGKFFSVSDLSCSYHQVPLSPETQKLTSSIIGGRQYTNTRGLYGLCGLPNLFSRLITIHFEPLIEKKQAITYIDDTIMQSQNKNEMFSIIHEYHNLLRKPGLKAAPEKTFFFLKNVKLLGHVISSDSQLQNGLRTWRILSQPSPNETLWNCWDALDFIVATSNIFTWTGPNHSMISLEILLHSIGLKSTKSF